MPQNSYDFRADRGLSDFQVEQRLVLSYLYDLPLGAGRKWLNNPGIINHIFGSWQTAGNATLQTGSPFTINMPSSQAAMSTTSFGIPYRPDQVGDPNKAGPVAANPGCSAPAHNRRCRSWQWFD